MDAHTAVNTERALAGRFGPEATVSRSVFFALALVATILVGPLAAARAVSDADIHEAVVNGLLMDAAVSAHRIDVDVSEGIVRLNGSVGHLLAHDQAERVAGTIRGVRGIVNDLEVRAVARSDHEIKEDINSALTLDPAAEAWEIGVEVEDGAVTLKGTVESWAERKLAGSVVKGVRGVRKLDNDVDVEYSKGRPDSEIRAEIVRRFEIDPLVNQSRIAVSVEDGRVELEGKAASQREKTEAYYDAFVAGVKEVDNEGIRVIPQEWAKMQRSERVVVGDDAEIRDAVTDAFAYDPRVDTDEVAVEVSGGIVTLRGVVDNLAGRNAAEEDAWNTTGVFRVENRIRVRPEEPLSDDRLAEAVRNRVAADPYLERFEITSRVRNGKVYLYGVVDSWHEKNRAGRVVSIIDGVVAVDNKLRVDHAMEPRNDNHIREAIRRNFIWNVQVDAGDIEVRVDDGVAILNGTADSWHEFYAAVDNAFEAGARRVEPRVKIDGVKGYVDSFSRDEYYYYMRHYPEG